MSHGSTRVGNILLGNCIGKGAFGSVWRGLNLETATTVAVKQVNLSGIPHADLANIMMEIDLLKKLNHPNIVKYLGFEKTTDYLNIILELCENGSLRSLIKNFGKLPEHLGAMYIAQVLDGLIYLHDQGVIHRDIKGANILATKNGLVKLADFGVATLSADVGDVNVAGTPYWMAPEIIELTGATTASDIWSVGCTVIELLDGEPPYHDLPPMGALYRIVQDDHPPIPESVSAMVRDFLMQCFQKDCNLRVSAKKLSKHAWIQTSKKKASGSQRNREVIPEYEEAVKSVQQWNEALKGSNGGQLSRNGSHRKSNSGRTRPSGYHERPSVAAVFQHNPPPQINLQQATFAKELVAPGANTGAGAAGAVVGAPRFHLPTASSMPSYEPEENTDNWDDDFADGISSLQLAALEIREQEDDMIKTIRPGAAGVGGRRLVRSPIPPPLASSNNNLSQYAENDDEDDDFDDQDLDMKLKQKFGQVAERQRGPRGGAPAHRPPSGSLAAREREQRVGATAAQFEATEMVRSRSAPGHLALQPSRDNDSSSGSVFQNYREDDDDDFSDLFESVGKNGEQDPDEGLALQSKLSSHSWFDDAGSDEEDPFAELEEDFHEIDLEANIARDKYARTLANIADLFKRIERPMNDHDLSDICDRLITVLSENPNIRGPAIANHGVIPLLDLIENKSEPTLVLKLLSILNLVVRNDFALLESLCLVGAIPVLMKYTSKRYGKDIQVAAASFIQQMCHTSTLTLQMFISCRGIRILIDFLESSYARQRELVWIAINGIHGVFDMQSPTPRNDFCRLLAKQGLLDPLSTTLYNTIKDPEAQDYTEKIIHVLLIFSQGDSPVKELLATRQIVHRMLDSLPSLPIKHCVTMLKCIKNISMNSNTLDVLQNANAIQTLTTVLTEREGQYANDICNHVLTTLFNLCRVNKSRQEEAARAGVVPHLQQIAESSSPLKQFALPMLCDLTHAGKACRNILWDNDCLQVYLRLLKDPYWQVNAIDAILVWLQDETSDVEQVLLQPSSLALLVQAFLTAKANSFENILEPLYKVTRLSAKVAIGMATPALFQRLMDRLAHPKAVVRLNLLRVLRAIFDVHPERSQIVVRYGIAQVVESIAEEDNAVLVKEMAREILEAFEESESDAENSLRIALPPPAPSPPPRKSIVKEEEEEEQEDDGDDTADEDEDEETEEAVARSRLRELFKDHVRGRFQDHSQEHRQEHDHHKHVPQQQHRQQAKQHQRQPSQPSIHKPLVLMQREDAPDELELSDSGEEEEGDDDDEQEVVAAAQRQRQITLSKVPSINSDLKPSSISLSVSGTIEDLVVKSVGSDTAAWRRELDHEGPSNRRQQQKQPQDGDNDDLDEGSSDEEDDEDVFQDSQGVWTDDGVLETVRLSPQAPQIHAFASISALSPVLMSSSTAEKVGVESQTSTLDDEDNIPGNVDGENGLHTAGPTESMVLRAGLPKIRLELLDIDRFPGWNREMLETNDDEEEDEEDDEEGSEDSDDINPATDFNTSPMNVRLPPGYQSTTARMVPGVGTSATSGPRSSRSASDSYVSYATRQQMQLAEMSRFDSPPPVLMRRRTLTQEQERSPSLSSSMPLLPQHLVSRALLDHEFSDDDDEQEKEDSAPSNAPQTRGNGYRSHNHAAAPRMPHASQCHDSNDSHVFQRSIKNRHSINDINSSRVGGIRNVALPVIVHERSDDENDDSDDNDDDDSDGPTSDTTDAQYVTAAPFSGNYDWNNHRLSRHSDAHPTSPSATTGAMRKNSNSFQTAVALDEVLQEYPHHLRRQFSEHHSPPPRPAIGLRRRASQTTH